MLERLKQWTAPRPRVEQPELLELGEGTIEEVRQNLRDMHRVNRWLGGHASLHRFLLPLIRRTPHSRPLRILDVATGAGQTPVALARWARRQRITITIVALDASRRVLGLAPDQLSQYPEISLLSADARDLPFGPASFDFVISTQFLHHLDRDGLIATLKDLATISRGRVILNDLVRSPTSVFLFRFCAPLFFRNRLTLHDGLASIDQAYTLAEMRAVLDAADLARARVHRHRFFRRMTIVIEPPRDPSPD